MNKIFKILLALIAIPIVFLGASGIFLYIGKLIIAIDMNLFPHHGDIYGIGETIANGAGVIVLMFIIISLTWLFYDIINDNL